MKKLIALLLTMMLLVSALGCTAAADDALFSEARTLRVALTSEPTTMDATQTVDTWSSTMFINIYETLLEINEEGELAPKLAESYDRSTVFASEKRR